MSFGFCYLRPFFACTSSISPTLTLHRVCEENPRAYLQPGTLIIGTCTGLLAASAIASSDSLIALIPLAVETVRLAFRLGATAARKAESLEASQTPWTSLVTGVDSTTVSVAVEEFNQTQVGAFTLSACQAAKS